jgi:Cellulase (glycosyl hydrolase family 5)
MRLRNLSLIALGWGLLQFESGCASTVDEAAAIQSGPGRKRPSVIGAKLLSDKGTFLRGVRCGLDYGGPLPPREKILALSDSNGLNAVHVYLEKWDTPTGANAAMADSLVEWTEKAGLYMVVTIGCGSHNGHFDTAQARAFWNFYAPRYADRAHVIYEIHNEPEFTCNASYADSTIRFESAMYDLIRSKAPKTMVLLFSYSNVPHADYALSDIRNLKTKVDWSNAALAYHGYYWCVQKAEEVDSVSRVVDSGYAMINTEFDDVGDWTVEAKRYEKMGIGWMNFQYLKGPDGAMQEFRQNVDTSGLRWVPDRGTWPLKP